VALIGDLGTLRGAGLATASTHLATLVTEVTELVARCDAATPSAREAEAARRLEPAALASLRLDGSPIEEAPTPAAVAAARATVDAAAVEDPRRGTWFDAMRAFDGVDPDDPEAAAADASVHALEYDGVVAAVTADDLAPELLVDPVPALAELHRRLTQHLVTPDRAGQLRRAAQAVHDAANGRILYFTVEPEQVATELEQLCRWLTDAGQRDDGLLVAGVVHLELLRIHPFDAANGRLARAAARLVLRARGLDPDRLTTPEPTLDEDRLGYHDEVARSLRRRDPTIWLERWAEAVTAGLRDAARALGELPTAVPDHLAAVLEGRQPGEALTVADLRDDVGLDAEAGRAAVRTLLDAGRLARVPGTRGLRLTVR
jgi:fido (protein-threonine AMPylation protein)